MPTFPDGSRVWINMDGKQLPEFQHVVEKDEVLKTHTITVYVPSEKGKEFSVGYYLTGSLTADMRTATVKMDGVKAESYKLDGSHYYRELKSDGWALNPTTIRKFVFGEIDTSQDGVAGSSSDMKAQVMRACIAFEYTDAIMGAPVPFLGSKVQVAEAVHPDSKLAAVVGAQVKPAAPTTLATPRVFSTHLVECKPGATKYIAKFVYRSAAMLMAMGIMPDPDAEAKDEENKVKAKKRKRSESVKPEDAAKGARESAQQRKKRLAAGRAAVKEELGPKEVVDLDAPPKPKVYVDLETGEEIVKQEQTGGESRAEAIDVEASPKNQRIYVELSDEDD